MYSLRDPALHAAVIQAMLDSGVRFASTCTVADGGEAMGIPLAMRQPAEEALAHAKAAPGGVHRSLSMAGWTSAWPSA